MTGVNFRYPGFVISFKYCFRYSFIPRLWSAAHYSFSADRRPEMWFQSVLLPHMWAPQSFLAMAMISELQSQTRQRSPENTCLPTGSKKIHDFHILMRRNAKNCGRIKMINLIDNNGMPVPYFLHLHKCSRKKKANEWVRMLVGVLFHNINKISLSSVLLQQKLGPRFEFRSDRGHEFSPGCLPGFLL